MMILYTILSTFILMGVWPIALVLWLVRKRYLFHRFLPPAGIAASGGPRVWIHAASVGESRIAYSTAIEIKRRRPTAMIFVSTATSTGLANIRRLNKTGHGNPVAGSFLAPFDHPLVVGRFVRRLRPTLMVVVETELWPWLLTSLRGADIPVVVINGRIGGKGVRRYLAFRRAVAKVAENLSLVCVQNRIYAARFRMIGVPEDRIRVLGNVKFDGLPEPGDIHVSTARRDLGLPQDVAVFTAGSTRPGEEMILAAAFVKLRYSVPNAILVIAPRHLNRVDEVVSLLGSSGISVARRSQVERPVDTGAAALLLDTMGELMSAFAAADVAFVGGSLADYGGHNPLEPAALAVPVLFGPFMTQSGCQELVNGGAARIVHDTDELARVLKQLMSDDQMRRQMADAGPEVVSNFKGTLSRTVDEMASRELL